MHGVPSIICSIMIINNRDMCMYQYDQVLFDQCQCPNASVTPPRPLVECQSVYKLRQPHVTHTHLWKCATGQCRSPSCPPPHYEVSICVYKLKVASVVSVGPRHLAKMLWACSLPQGGTRLPACLQPLSLQVYMVQGRQALQTGRPTLVGGVEGGGADSCPSSLTQSWLQTR